MAEIVKRLHTVHIYADALLSEKCGQLRVAPPPLVAWYVKGNDPTTPPGVEAIRTAGSTADRQPCVALLIELKAQIL